MISNCFSNIRKSDKLVEATLNCIECYFGLSEYEKANSLMQTIVKKQPKNANVQYWYGIILFYLYQYTGEGKKKEIAVKAENTLLGTYTITLIVVANLRKNEKKGLRDIMIMWMLLIISLEMKYKYPKLKMKLKNTLESYSYEIKKIDEYLGFLSWIELYIYTDIQEKIDNAKDMLWQLITDYPSKPEAYLKLWSIYIKENKYEKCMSLCENILLNVNDIEDNEYM